MHLVSPGLVAPPHLADFRPDYRPGFLVNNQRHRGILASAEIVVGLTIVGAFVGEAVSGFGEDIDGGGVIHHIHSIRFLITMQR